MAVRTNVGPISMVDRRASRYRLGMVSTSPIAAFTLRKGRPEDAARLGQICYEAFAGINAKHQFPPDFPNADVAVGFMEFVLTAKDVFSVVAERKGQLLGSSFLWEQGPIGGVGPVTVDPATQDRSVGRALMGEVLRRAGEARLEGVRLLQAGFHMRSLCLYAKLGFEVKEPLLCMNGEAIGETIPGDIVRPMAESDLPRAAALCESVHGYARTGELVSPVATGAARVAERNGELVAYTAGIGFFGHAVARDNEGLKSLIGAADVFSGPGFLLPSRNADVLRWCLDRGLRAVQPLNLMAKGAYQDPKGAFMPSILF